MSKDIIYREDAIKAINLRARIPHDVASAHYANMAINAIRSVPSADRPQGEWMATEDFDEWYGLVYKCNICGDETIGGCDNYCPNYDADMRGGHNE